MSKVHRLMPLGKRLSCSQCGSKFSNRAMLKIHSRSHTGGKAHECNVCKRTFLVARSLQLHMRTHNDSQRQNMGPKKYFLENEEHVNLKSRERCYKCELCLHLFPKREDISKHLKQIHRIFNEDVHRKHITFLMTSYSKPGSPGAHGIQSQRSVEEVTPEKHSPDRGGDISKINSPISNMELFISQLELVPMRPIDTSGTADLGKAPTPRPPELEHPPSSVGPREVMYMRGFEDSESHVVAMTIGNEGGDEMGYPDRGNSTEISQREWAKLNAALKGGQLETKHAAVSSEEKSRGFYDGGESDGEVKLEDDVSLDTIRFNRSTDNYLKDVTSYDDPAFKRAMRIAEETSKQFAEMMNWNSLYNLYDSKNQLNISSFSQEEVWQFLQTTPEETKPPARRKRRRKNTPTKISNPKALGRVSNKKRKPRAAPKSSEPKSSEPNTSEPNSTEPRRLRPKRAPRKAPRKKYLMKCHICAGKFEDEVALDDHLKRHAGSESNFLKCRRCPKVFATKYSLANHERTHSRYRPYHCKLCGKGFYQKGNIKIHMRSHTGERPYKCEFCGKAYSVKISLAHHSGSHPENRFSCSKCKFCFARPEDLEEHMKVHAIQKSRECPKCNKSFLKAYLLEAHLQRGCKDKKFTCHHCGKQFNSLDDLKKHYRVHTGEKPFKCEVCGKYFSQSANLKKHLKIHNNVRPYACDFCPATFIERAAMQAHRRSHTGEKPHMCDICGTSFSSRSSLVIHMRKHTGEKPYPCDMCEKRFISSSKLRDHYYYHHAGDNPYNYRKSDQTFTLPNGLVKHSRIPPGEGTHKCGVCAKLFVSKNRLTRHLTVVHKQNKGNMSHLYETHDSQDSHASMDSHASHTSHASHMSHDHHMHQQHQHQHYQHRQQQQQHRQQQQQQQQHLQPLQAHQQQPQMPPQMQPPMQPQSQPQIPPQSQAQPQQANMMNMPGFTVAPQPMFGYGYLY